MPPAHFCSIKPRVAPRRAAGASTVPLNRSVATHTLIGALALSFGCGAVEPDQEAQNKRLVREYTEVVFNQGATERLPEFVSPDYVEVYDNQTYALGLEGAKAHVDGVRAAFPNLQITIEQQFCDGNWVVSRITASGTHNGAWLGMKPTGKKLSFTGVNIDRVENGLIVEHGGAANLFAPLLAAGAIHLSDGGEPD